MPTVNSSMQGKICMVTGANSGIGKATALGLAQMGATVVMVCRDRARGEEARSEITTTSRKNAVDLLLADLLLDVLKASAPARIVNVSSNSHEAGYIQMDDLQAEHYRSMRVYGQSKLAVVLFTYELARRLQGTGVTANCLHPGFVATHFGQRDVGPAFRLLVKVIGRFGTSPQEGAKTSIYLASSPEVEGVTGKYFVKSLPKRSAAISYEESLQRHLWEQSAKLVNL